MSSPAVALTSPHQVTQLLVEWGKGNQAALDQLMPLVYQELYRIARRYMSQQNPGHSLQATALINEAYIRLVGDSTREWQGRSHFFAVAATSMRHILVDHARASHTAKRGGNQRPIPLDETIVSTGESMADVIALDKALSELAKLNVRQSKVVELRYFGGLSVGETATALGISAETAMRDWRAARVWLYRKVRASSAENRSNDT